MNSSSTVNPAQLSEWAIPSREVGIVPDNQPFLHGFGI
jgi:hypothetical protein